jgi:heparan-sulfate lyase
MRNSVITFIIICLLALFGTSASAQELNMQLFDLINLDAPGLEQVKSFCEQGKYSDAASALLFYYKGRKGIVFTDLDMNNLKLSAADRKMADEALEHKFFAHKGYQPSYFYGDDIDWTYWPVRDNELRWQLHRQKWFIPMGKAYQLTGDEKYAKEWTLEYLDWIKKNPLTKPSRRKTIGAADDPYDGDTPTDDNVRYAWRPLEVSHRLQDQAAEFLLFSKSPSFTPEFFSEFLVNVHRHASHILANYSSQGNHLLFEAQRVLYAGIFFPELKDAAAWRRSAIDVLNREIGVQVYPDGMQFELDPHYHLAAINIFFKALQMADANGYRAEFPASFLDTIEKMIAATYNLSFPDYTNPMFSDAKLNAKSEMLKNYKQWLEVFPDNDTIRWFATQGKKGVRPAYDSHALMNSGFYVMRTGWDKDATVMMLKAGPKAFWHCQPDNGTFELMIKGRNFFTDSGSYVYAGDDEVMKWRNWFRQTSSHKTLTLDNRDLEQTDSHCLLWKIDEPTEVLAVENPSYAGLTHRRSVFFVDKKFFVIVDEAVGDAKGNVGIHFQLGEGNAKFDSKTMSVATQHDDGNNVVVRSFGEKKGAFTLEEEEGWVSYEYRKKTERPAWVLSTDKAASDNAVRLITVIYPTSDAAKAPTIEAKFTDKGFDAKALGLTVKAGKQQYKLGYTL